MQEWMRETGARITVIFEGRDASGKGGAIKRIIERLNPRWCRIVALPAPTEGAVALVLPALRPHLPAAGEIVLFDRSWYNRAGVEHVMGFCTPDEYRRFLHQCPVFDGCSSRTASCSSSTGSRSATRSRNAGSARGSTTRYEAGSCRRWTSSRGSRWIEYSRAKDEMFVHTDIRHAPWYVVEGDDKRRARLNCIAHLLSQIPYEVSRPPNLTLPERQSDRGICPPRPLDDDLRARPCCDADAPKLRKDVREFIRRLEAAGLTVEPTPGHYHVLRGKPLRRQTACRSPSRSRPTRPAGAGPRSSTCASSESTFSRDSHSRAGRLPRDDHRWPGRGAREGAPHRQRPPLRKDGRAGRCQLAIAPRRDPRSLFRQDAAVAGERGYLEAILNATSTTSRSDRRSTRAPILSARLDNACC